MQYLLNGNNDPWMFHQANTRNYDGAGHSLLTDLLDTTFGKYAAVATLPIVSPTMDDLAGRVRNRMAFNSSGVVATMQAGSSLTVSVSNAATVPVTGLCTPGAETYASQTISYLALNAGQTVTLSLTDCNPGGRAAPAEPLACGGGMSGASRQRAASGGGAGSGGGAAGGTVGSGGIGGTGGGAPDAGGAAGAGEGETGAGGAEGSDASVATGGETGGKTGGTGGGGTGGHDASVVSPPPQTGAGCNCAFSDDLPGPGACLFTLLGGGLTMRSRRRGRAPSARPSRSVPGSC